MPQIYIGTSGYSYADWNGIFYPEGLKKTGHLEFYATHFNTVEINFTYYAIPNPHIFDSMASRVPRDFSFAVKVHRSMTHTRDCSKDDYFSYVEALQPLIESGKLGPLLMQFPWGFKFSRSNMDYLESLKEYFGGLDIAVEFRHQSWLRDEVIDFLESQELGYCNVDQPALKTLLPPTDINTTGTGYIRFHGRNYKHWWKPRQAYMRYDYIYEQKELMDWLPRIKKVSENTKKTHIYFNNHYKAQAVRSAKLLQSLFD